MWKSSCSSTTTLTHSAATSPLTAVVEKQPTTRRATLAPSRPTQLRSVLVAASHWRPDDWSWSVSPAARRRPPSSVALLSQNCLAIPLGSPPRAGPAHRWPWSGGRELFGEPRRKRTGTDPTLRPAQRPPWGVLLSQTGRAWTCHRAFQHQVCMAGAASLPRRRTAAEDTAARVQGQTGK